MANISTAKVTITTEHVGAELEAYIRAAAASEYTILDEDTTYGGIPFSVEKHGDTWVFTGMAAGQWDYGNNLDGYFSRTAEEPVPELAAGWLDEEANAFFEALTERNGVVRFVVADSDEGLGWVESSTAVCRVGEDGQVRCEKTSSGRQDYTTANVMAAYGYDLREAAHLRLEEDAEEFFRQWHDEHPGEEPKPEDFDEWAENW